MQRGEGIVRYRAGSGLAVNCGYIGTGLMLIAILYAPLRRLKAFRRLASNTMWFDFHMMAGTMGPAFILLHTALKLDNWVSTAFWSMVIVVLSGVIGRYLYTKVPDLTNGRELEELDHQRAIARLGVSHPHAASLADQVIGLERARAQWVTERRRLVGAFIWIVVEDLARPFRWVRRARAFRAAGAPPRVARDLAYRTGRLLLVERRRVLLPRAQLLLHAWKKVHVPFSFVMAGIAAVHIWLVFQNSL